MKIILVGINSKYIHTNLAIRYLKVNTIQKVIIKEYTIKDKIEYIYNNIIDSAPDILGFSIYIWNVEIIKQLLKKIRSDHPKIKIILGGPEVSYESDEFVTNNLADFIISNEGEISFNLLVEAITGNYSYENIPNLTYLNNGSLIKNKIIEIKHLEKLKNPYHLQNEDIKNKIQYVELSRGCPYNCSYCLASLEKKVRFFPIDSIYENIKYLYNKGAKTFKFLDRTFNLKPDMAITLFKFLIENNFDNAVFQFEISGDILNDEIINYLIVNCPKDLIRFEIGIQSIHQIVNKSVNRKQNTEHLFFNIKQLKKSNVIMHLDLIAGLPHSNLAMFIETFNQTFKLYADELQLGFLKILKGTALYYQKALYEYQVQERAPYEIIKNMYLTKNDTQEIHLVEEALEIYWNKSFFKNSIKLITESKKSAYHFFLELAKLFEKRNQGFHRYQLSDVAKTLEEYMNQNDIIYDIRLDYLMYHQIKPKIYWNNDVNKNQIIRLFHQKNPEYNLDKLYKYTLVTIYKDMYLLVIYYPSHKEFHKIKA